MSNLASAIDELATTDMDSVSAEDLGHLLIELTRQAAALDSVRAQAVASFRRRGLHEIDGHVSMTAWLKHRCRMSAGDASGLVSVARALPAMPITRRAFASGDIDLRSVRRLVEASEAHPVVFQAHEQALVEAAATLSPWGLWKTLAYWRQAADYDRALVDQEALFDQRRVHISPTFGGMVRIDGDLDPESGEIVATAIGAVAETQGKAIADKRTPAQRRADALVEICRRYLDGGAAPGRGGVKPHISVVIDATALGGAPANRSETTRGTVLHPETIRRLACDASVSRVLVDATSQPLDVGRASRTIPAAIRRALVVRDGGCTHPGCDRPPEWTDAHHIVHWADGGETNLDNLVLLCRRHHRMAHPNEWEP